MSQKQLNRHTSAGKHPERLSHPAIASGRIGHAAEPSDPHAGGFFHTLKGLLLPFAVAAATGLGAVTLLTVAVGNHPDPSGLIPILGAVALTLSSLAGGIAAGLCNRDRAIAGSLVSGGILTALLCAVGLIFGGQTAGIWSAYPPIVAWVIRLVPLPIHALGGVLTRPRPQKASHTAGGHPARRS